MSRNHIRPDGARKVTQSSGVQEEHFLPQLCPHYALPLSLRQPAYAGTRKGSGLREMMKQGNDETGDRHIGFPTASPSPASPPPRPRSGMERKPPACSRMDKGLSRVYRDRWERWNRPIRPIRFRRLSRFIRFYRPPPQTPRRRPAAPLMMERPADPTNSQTGWRRSRGAAGAGRMRRAGARRGGWDWRRPALDRVPSERRGCAR
jgi:hypothetical protein